ncbi:MAG TPA: BMP family ABC transporter substrate-binding protein [Methylomirabilota bacterium]|nr:BMP family ABC transporter substrate-binding protein [Methylomirabilota bacterium]
MRVLRFLAVGAAASLLAIACGGGGSTGGTSNCSKTWKVGLVTDVGKLSDKSFNATSWQGVLDAQSDKSLCVQGRAIESQQPTDYQKNMQTFADQNYDMVVAVGFLMSDDSVKFAKEHPNLKVALVDPGGTEQAPANWVGLGFREDEAGFLAGALAGMFTKSNTVAGVYGLDVPAVVRFRKGYETGAQYVNKNVKVLGIYQPPGPKAFNDPDWGKARAIEFADQGADVIFGGGGNTGNGALLGALQKNRACVGVDVDQYNSYPDAQKCLLTSAEKKLAVAVKQAITDVVKGSFKSGIVTFSLKNKGVGLAPYHEYDSKVTADMRSKLQEIEKQLADGTLKTGAPA